MGIFLLKTRNNVVDGFRFEVANVHEASMCKLSIEMLTKCQNNDVQRFCNFFRTIEYQNVCWQFSETITRLNKSSL